MLLGYQRLLAHLIQDAHEISKLFVCLDLQGSSVSDVILTIFLRKFSLFSFLFSFNE